MDKEPIVKTANRNETRFELGTDQMLKIPRTPRVNITCTAGWLWITEDGINEDVELGRGATHTSHGKGNVIVYAFEPSGFDASRIPSAIARCLKFVRTLGTRLSRASDYARPAS